MPIKKMQDLDLTGKTVVIREDLNVPMKDGQVSNDKRIRASLPTITTALEKGAGVVLLSHLGRPTEGQYEEQFSLKPVAARLSELLGKPVALAATLEEAKAAPGAVTLLENVRFLKGEKKNDPALAAQLAALGDVYVMDAFGAAHRAHASTEGAVRVAKVACAGPLLQAELDAFAKVLNNPARPLAAIIGGSKVSTKLALLENLLEKVDVLIVGGGIANTFLAAAGYMVGKSLYEEDLVTDAKRIMEQAKNLNRELPLPVDVVTAEELAPGQAATTRAVGDVPADQMILDVGRDTIAQYKKLLSKVATVVWNGPVGAFETDPFGEGTKELAHYLADSKAFVVVGGGDSVAAVEKYGLSEKMGYISTGGGASLELLEGKVLPSVAALEARG
ncbi:phosphoglycerate kinase [uncultured Desulfovibrio sp.]|uniref:Phosphoglycerate kinase n=3 Tax=Desulfovibrio TaxID=872 RepID=A0A212JHK2_9BACT|nr:phosphoglycerate kinase [Desulfovibrio desulfuricans]MCB6541621.1 phosphoglycerate kinase [Desulfovibrio desulfuricans]MCB6552702.1 phosphoglycerate kinase [Desulfovibrio desulfuricans]MCB6564675.1 phosphoglycerate kinase [Desulfovibrio desulfuricans]MCB7345727.1 phosphoglycerate kinase [Desulfovibrio desulfuricans]MCQ4862039.1 phosphoglycerate kinase [Desulfovibrio desulfuricans]